MVSASVVQLQRVVQLLTQARMPHKTDERMVREAQVLVQEVLQREAGRPTTPRCYQTPPVIPDEPPLDPEDRIGQLLAGQARLEALLRR